MTSLVCIVSTTKRKKKSMSRFKRLSHTIWHCEYHIVWVPKYRYRVMQGKIKEEVGKAANDPDLEVSGKAEKKAGKVQKWIGRAEKAVGE